jgi:hypothetical protein
MPIPSRSSMALQASPAGASPPSAIGVHQRETVGSGSPESRELAVHDFALRAQGAGVVSDGEGEIGGARVGMAGAPFGSGMRL